MAVSNFSVLSAEPCREPVEERLSTNSTKIFSTVLASMVPSVTMAWLEIADFLSIEPFQNRPGAFFAQRQHHHGRFFGSAQASVCVP